MGDINESFYISVENTFTKALGLLEEDGTLEKYRIRAQKTVDDADGMGWGFGDAMADIFYEYYD